MARRSPKGPPRTRLAGIAGWINSEPLTLQDLHGKVVLVDIWTYCYINCIRTLPHIRKWNEKYTSKGLVIAGLHSPEFEFEKSEANVREAVIQERVTRAGGHGQRLCGLGGLLQQLVAS